MLETVKSALVVTPGVTPAPWLLPPIIPASGAAFRRRQAAPISQEADARSASKPGR